MNSSYCSLSSLLSVSVSGPIMREECSVTGGGMRGMSWAHRECVQTLFNQNSDSNSRWRWKTHQSGFRTDIKFCEKGIVWCVGADVLVLRGLSLLPDLADNDLLLTMITYKLHLISRHMHTRGTYLHQP